MADKKPLIDILKMNEEDETGTTGQGGQIAFRDFTSNERLRDDLLSAQEIKRLIGSHVHFHEAEVKKQKQKRDEYKALKEGKVSLPAHRQGQGLSSGAATAFKNHPLLSKAAQFSGIDRQVSTLPNEYSADTNEEAQNELQNQLRLRYAPAATFNPRPQR